MNLPARSAASPLPADAWPDAAQLDEAIMRNVDVVGTAEQAAVRAQRILVAGCGSVGGSVVESLVRLGATCAVLADPESFDRSNLNRQACTLADLGRNKAQVLAERALAIDPYFQATVLPEGLTEANLEAAIDGATVVFDAIDAGASPWVKYRLHELACERRIPVVAGFDFGGKAALYVFDYRARRSTPFHGRATAQAHRDGNLAQCVKWLGYRHFPADFLGVIEDRMRTGRPWPQVSYCVLAMGALATRCVIDLAMRRKVPHVVAFDTHQALRRPFDRLRQVLLVPVRLVGAYRASRRGRVAAPTVDARDAGLPPALAADATLRRVLEAMVLSPSPHNCQPWKFVPVGPREIRIDWDRARGLPAVDPDAFAIAYSLGCAIEAAASVADVEFVPGPDVAETAAGYFAGTLRIHGLRASSYARGFGLLEQRVTQRGAFVDVPHSAALTDRLDALARAHGARAVLRTPAPARIAAMGRRGAAALFRRPDYVAELLAHLRLRRAEQVADATGFTPAALQLSWAEARLLAALRRWPRLRRVATALGLPWAMARSAVAGLSGPASFVLVTASRWTPRGRVDAGRALMRVWLELTAQGLDCQPVDFPISDAAGRADALALFDLPAGERPIVLLRVGRAVHAAPRRSPRLPLARFWAAAPAADAVRGVATATTTECVA